jgi:hypothetical protein
MKTMNLKHKTKTQAFDLFLCQNGTYLKSIALQRLTFDN